LTERVLGGIFEVAHTLGAGFLEKVYQRALRKELSILGIQAVSQASFPVTYKGEYVGEYYPDILVEKRVGGRTEMRRTPEVPTHRSMSELPAGLWQESLSFGQFSEAHCRVEAGRPPFPALGFVLHVLFDSVVLTVACSLIYSTHRQ